MLTDENILISMIEKISLTDLFRLESKAHHFQKDFSSKKTTFCSQFVAST